VSTSVQIPGVFLACLLDQVDALYGRIITRDSYGVHAHVLLMFAILQDIVVEKVERLICIHCCLTLTSSKTYMTQNLQLDANAKIDHKGFFMWLHIDCLLAQCF
jgi:hypothetical protein